MCSSFDHNANSCPYYPCYAQPNFLSPRDNTDIVLTLPYLFLPLAQGTRFQVGEPFGYVARVSGDSACLESKGTFDRVHNLAKTPVEGCHNVFTDEKSPTLGYDNVLPNPLDHSHVSPICSPPLSFPWYSLDVPIDNFEICNSNVDLGYEDNMLNMLGRNVACFLSLGYFSGYHASLLDIVNT